MGNAKISKEEGVSPEDLDLEAAVRMTESLVSGDDEDDSLHPTVQDLLAENRYFRCLGYREGELVFANTRTAFIQNVKIKELGSKVFLSLAPMGFWNEIAPKLDEKGRETKGVNWEEVMDLVFRATEDAGIWNDRNQHEQGARFDEGRVVFHTGEKVWVDGIGVMNPGEVHGKNCYTARIGAPLPDFITPFEQDDPEVRKLLSIIKSLAWRPDSRGLSEMTLFGYLSIASVCGILKWRPHVWLDGARGDGKTWVVQNIVNRVLGQHCEMVKSNSTESGLRNLLHARSVPVIFDEAEGSSSRDKARMEEIISLARHTSSETDAVVAQGVSGGGASRRFAISSMFFLASIATRIDKPSDQTRFARISLGPGLRGTAFTQQVEVPALNLLTPEFTDRFIGRAAVRARDAERVIRVMTGALMMSGMERRVADVYAVFAAGAWLALRDGVPEDENEALSFISREFGALEQIRSVNADLSRDRDHDRVIRTLMSSSRRIETANGPVVTERIGMLLRIVAGRADDEDTLITARDALRELNDFGIRPSRGSEICDAGPEVTHFLVHRRSESIRTALDKTPYETGYAEILLQARDVRISTASVRFRGTTPERALVVPIEAFLGNEGPETPEAGTGEAEAALTSALVSTAYIRPDKSGESAVFTEPSINSNTDPERLSLSGRTSVGHGPDSQVDPDREEMSADYMDFMNEVHWPDTAPHVENVNDDHNATSQHHRALRDDDPV